MLDEFLDRLQQELFCENLEAENIYWKLKTWIKFIATKRMVAILELLVAFLWSKCVEPQNECSEKINRSPVLFLIDSNR